MRSAFRALFDWFKGEDPNTRSRQARRKEEPEEAKAEPKKKKKAKLLRYVRTAPKRRSWRIGLSRKEKTERLRAWKRIWRGIPHANL